MTTSPNDLLDMVRRELASWHATHPDATFADMEDAVEVQIARLRASLLQERTTGAREDRHPICPACGTTMEPRTQATRIVVLPGEEPVAVERTYVVCPACGTGLFPPG